MIFLISIRVVIIIILISIRVVIIIIIIIPMQCSVALVNTKYTWINAYKCMHLYQFYNS